LKAIGHKGKVTHRTGGGEHRFPPDVFCPLRQPPGTLKAAHAQGHQRFTDASFLSGFSAFLPDRPSWALQPVALDSQEQRLSLTPYLGYYEDQSGQMMDGFEATRQIRRLERNRQLAAVPVIALTAHILEDQRQHGLDAGMDDFLGKPLDSGLLYRTLERYLKPAEP